MPGRRSPAGRMNFVQIEFVAFFGVVYALYWALRDRAYQNALLVVASAVFYGWVHPWFVLLLYAASSLDFASARLMAEMPERRRLFLACSLAGNLGMLSFFKYFDFFVANVAAALTSLGLQVHPHTLGVLLPVGISFYTFQTIGYVVDVYRGELAPRRRFLDYILYVSFFPQLVAGPIARAGRLLPRIESSSRFSGDDLRTGLSLALWGAFKKVVIADSIAPYVDKVFVLERPVGPLLWAATAAFMIQIFADFSGYTDLARGTARMLGFSLGENFRAPFLATTTSEFWQRWHISLSSWVRDYLLGPLVGDAPEHATRARFAMATVISFLAMGFWHGASWNFLLFGLYHGCAVLTYAAVVRRLPAWSRRIPLGRPLAAGVHLGVVGLPGSLLFREQSVTRLVGYLSLNPFSASQDEWIATWTIAMVTAIGCAPLLCGYAFDRWILPRVQGSPWHLPLRTTGWAACAVGLAIFYRVTAQDFVYFRF